MDEIEAGIRKAITTGPDYGCEKEPIHSPGSIQPHGYLLAFDLHGVVTHVSANFAELGGPRPECAIGTGLPDATAWDDPAFSRRLSDWLAQRDGSFSGDVTANGVRLQVQAHVAGDHVILELEREAPHDQGGSSSYRAGGAQEAQAGLLQSEVVDFLQAAEASDDWLALAELAARRARRVTGFDRVLIYRFDPSWNGAVVAEDGNGVLPSLRGLRFPASDIPAQARALYRRNRIRMIPRATYTPVPVLPDCGPASAAPLEMQDVALRSVSPLHLRYMQNMGTMASMSASLIVDGQLWGLIACHSRDAHYASPAQRNATVLLAQGLAGAIGSRDHALQRASVAASQAHHDRLLAAMAVTAGAGRLAQGGAIADRTDGDQALGPHSLGDASLSLLGLTEAAGAAIVMDGRVLCFGETPGDAPVRAIAAWLEANTAMVGDVFATESLRSDMPDAASFAAVASGILAIPISEVHPNYVIWFRPELIRTVDWAGKPEKIVDGDGSLALSPRASFALWQETVRGTARPWTEQNIAAAARLRQAIVGVVLRKAEELALLNRELMRTNKELEAFSYSISHDLRAPFRHVAGYAELLREHLGEGLDETGRRFLGTISGSAEQAGRLVDDLLHFSRLGRTALRPDLVGMNKLVEDCRRGLELEQRGRRVEWRIGDLPPAWADPALLRQAVLNLLSNAVKYTRERDHAVIEVSGKSTRAGSTYIVRDNGVGFDMAYVGKLFGVFQRLHLAEQYEGTGIGLALASRIIERHGGTIEAEGALGQGAVFRFTLPARAA